MILTSVAETKTATSRVNLFPPLSSLRFALSASSSAINASKPFKFGIKTG